MSKIVIIGGGVMGLAIADGLANAGWDDVHVVEPDPNRREHIAGTSTVAVHESYCDDMAADAIVIAVKPNLATSVAAQITSTRPVVLSICAGVTIEALSNAMPAGTAIVRVMPNTPAQVGYGLSVLSAGEYVTEAQLELARSIMLAVGQALVMAEALQDAATAVSGSGPAYVFYVAEAMIEAGVQMGLTRNDATTMTIQTIRGAAELLASGEHPSVLRERVTSPGGTTAAAVRALDEHAVRAGIAHAMWAAHDKSSSM